MFKTEMGNTPKNHKAFTLVELIMTITILVIIWVIWFFSLTGYSENARDGLRIDTLANIHKSLAIINIKTGTYPNPEMYALVEWVSKQWYVGDYIAKILKINNSVKDPLDNDNYLYSIDLSWKKIQLSAFLEKQNSMLSIDNVIPKIKQASALWIDYSKRYIYSIGDKVWLVVTPSTMVPINEKIGTGSLDITTDSWSYMVSFPNPSSQSGVLTGTGLNLLIDISAVQNWCTAWTKCISDCDPWYTWDGVGCWSSVCTAGDYNPVSGKCEGSFTSTYNATPTACIANWWAVAPNSSIIQTSACKYTIRVDDQCRIWETISYADASHCIQKHSATACGGTTLNAGCTDYGTVTRCKPIVAGYSVYGDVENCFGTHTWKSSITAYKCDTWDSLTGWICTHTGSIQDPPNCPSPVYKNDIWKCY